MVDKKDNSITESQMPKPTITDHLQLEHRISQLEQSHNALVQRMENIEKSINECTNAIHKLTVTLERTTVRVELLDTTQKTNKSLENTFVVGLIVGVVVFITTQVIHLI